MANTRAPAELPSLAKLMPGIDESNYAISVCRINDKEIKVEDSVTGLVKSFETEKLGDFFDSLQASQAKKVEAKRRARLKPKVAKGESPTN